MALRVGTDETLDYTHGWYHLFSTVPQTLAAAYAVMFAFALLRFQDLQNSIEGLAIEIAGFFERLDMASEYRAEVGRHATLRQWEDYLRKTRAFIANPRVEAKFGGEQDPGRSKSTVHSLLTALDQRLDDFSNLRRRLRRTLSTTVFIIVVTTLAIPLGRFVTLERHFILGWLVVFVLMVFVGYLYLLTMSALVPRLEEAADKETSTDDPS